MEKQDRLQLTIPNDLSYISLAQHCVCEMARRIGFAHDAVAEIELAVEEACANVIKHGFEPGEHGTFDIACERVPLGIKIVLKDKGIPFDPKQLPQYDPDAALTERSTAGMGTFLMKEVMDEVSYHNLGLGGKEMHLVRHLPRRAVTDYFSAAELKAEEGPRQPKVIEEKIEYVARRLEPREAIEVSKCAYKSHGYTFFDDHIYYPERIVELNESGEMVSIVAVTKKDSIFMGHTAFVYPYPGAEIAELTFAFVNVEYRGQGCLSRMMEELVRTPKRFELSGMYAYAVANHLFTQKAMVRYKIHDCGILLATSPATWEFKGISESNDQRISVVLSYQYLKPPVHKAIYAPPQHAEMIGKLYQIIEAKAELRTPPAMPELPNQASEIETTLFASEQCGEIVIGRCGSQVAREVRIILRDLCLKGMAAINLFLNLEDPATYYVTAELEKLGFFFAGILPGSKGGDSLILQYLNNVPFDYAKVLAYSPMAQEILAYIKARDPNVVQ